MVLGAVPSFYDPNNQTDNADKYKAKLEQLRICDHIDHPLPFDQEQEVAPLGEGRTAYRYWRPHMQNTMGFFQIAAAKTTFLPARKLLPAQPLTAAVARESYVKRADQYAKGADAAEKVLSGIRDGKVNPKKCAGNHALSGQSHDSGVRYLVRGFSPSADRSALSRMRESRNEQI